MREGWHVRSGDDQTDGAALTAALLRHDGAAGGQRGGGRVAGEVFTNPRYRYAILLSLTSCSITAILSVWVAVPTAYLLTRVEFPGRRLLDAVLDIPIVLPPLVIGLPLLMLFQTAPGRFVQGYVRFTYAVPGVILAWARAMGEFGPVLVFAGTTAFRTEVMPTSIVLELRKPRLGWFARRALEPRPTERPKAGKGEAGGHPLPVVAMGSTPPAGP